MTRLGVATCQECPELQPDDALGLGELRGAEIVAAPWDDPSVRWGECSAVLLRSVWDYHLRVGQFLGWLEALEAAGTTVWNPPATVAWNARKSYLRALGAAGVSTVPTLWLEAADLARWPAAIERAGWDDVVLKPVVGASSYLTWRSSAAAAARRVDRLERLAAQGGALLQPFLPEIEHRGEWSLIYFEGRFSHAVRKRAKAGEFRVQIEFGGSESVERPPPAARESGRRALRAVPDRPLYARLDGVETAAGFLVSELELIEPVLFLAAADGAAARFAAALAARLDLGARP